MGGSFVVVVVGLGDTIDGSEVGSGVELGIEGLSVSGGFLAPSVEGAVVFGDVAGGIVGNVDTGASVEIVLDPTGASVVCSVPPSLGGDVDVGLDSGGEVGSVVCGKGTGAFVAGRVVELDDGGLVGSLDKADSVGVIDGLRVGDSVGTSDETNPVGVIVDRLKVGVIDELKVGDSVGT